MKLGAAGGASGAGPRNGRPSPRTRLTAVGLQQIRQQNLPVQCPHDSDGGRLRRGGRKNGGRPACFKSADIKSADKK